MIKYGFSNFNQIMYKNLNEWIENGRFEGKKIVLFGLNSSSYCIKSYLQKNNLDICAYIDNNEKKCEEVNQLLEYYLPHHISASLNYDEIKRGLVPAYLPENLLSDFDDTYVILIASKYYNQMKEQLGNMGYIENKHIIKVIDFYDLEEYVDFSDVEGLQELSIDEMKQIELTMLKRIREICEQHQLRYYLCGGTLLGAVRHKGFIPWDDDIDIALPMSDYKKLLQLLKKEKKYDVLNPYVDADKSTSLFAKIIDKSTILKSWHYPYLSNMGVFIDIFPLYGLPEAEEDRIKFYEKIQKLYVRKITEFMEHDEPTEKYFQLHDQILSMMGKYDFDDATYIGYLLSQYKEKEIMPRTIYEKSTNLEFEGETFNVAGDYKEYLRRIFGDYMKLPPEEQRNTLHYFRAYKVEE